MSLIFEDYFAGSGRAAHADGHYLVIPSGFEWLARFDRDGGTVWQESHDTFEAAEAACNAHAGVVGDEDHSDG